MRPELIGVLIPVLVAFIAAVPGILAYLATRRNQMIGKEENAVSAWRSFVEPLRTEVAQLRHEVDELQAELERHKQRIQHLEQENGVLRSGAELLLHQVRSNGITPVWGERELGNE